MAEVSQTGKSRRKTAEFRKSGGFPARLKRKAQAAAGVYQQLRVPNDESHVAPLARGYRALRRKV